MAQGTFAQWILFAEDMVMHFMNQYNIDITLGTNGQIWNGHPRRFTQQMGEVAWHIPYLPPWRFTVDQFKKPTFLIGYNPYDFLQYCGYVSIVSVDQKIKGAYEVADGVVLTITTYLGDITEDGTFAAAGGWDGLANFADAKVKHWRRLE